MNAQDTFDRVVSGLRKQGCKSQRAGGGICMYRGPYDTKCAAGLLIPDEKYTDDLEGMAVYINALGDETIYLPGMTRPMYVVLEPSHDKLTSAGLVVAEEGHNLRLVRQLQEVHDQHAIDEWEVYFQAVAELFNLTYTPPA